MDFQYVLITFFGILIAAVGYFLKFIHKESKDTLEHLRNQQVAQAESLGEVRGEIKMVDQRSTSAINRLQATTEIEIRNIQKEITNIGEKVDKSYDILITLQKD